MHDMTEEKEHGTKWVKFALSMVAGGINGAIA